MEALVTPTAAFWRGKRVLLTGHTGFKGSWLALWLERLGADVRGLALPPASAIEGKEALWTALGQPGAQRFGDIRDPKVVAAAFAEQSPEIVFHLAAQALVHTSYREPAETFDTNVMGLVRILDAARQTSSVRAFINVTSDKCYENVEHPWPYRESEPMGGSDPYSASKGCAELVTTSYRRSYFSDPAGAQLASARAGNVIGGGDWSADRLVPDCIRAFYRNDTLLVRNPLATRPWQHVLEPLCGYLLLAERLCTDGHSFAQGWNFGPSENDAWSVAEIADAVSARWGNGASWDQDSAARPHEAMLLRVDASKARSTLKWKPRLPIADGLLWTVDWYRRFLNGDDARVITLEQIRAFENVGVIE